MLAGLQRLPTNASAFDQHQPTPQDKRELLRLAVILVTSTRGAWVIRSVPLASGIRWSQASPNSTNRNGYLIPSSYAVASFDLLDKETPVLRPFETDFRCWPRPPNLGPMALSAKRFRLERMSSMSPSLFGNASTFAVFEVMACAQTGNEQGRVQ